MIIKDGLGKALVRLTKGIGQPDEQKRYREEIMAEGVENSISDLGNPSDDDLTLRIGDLKAANRRPTKVAPGDPISRATTIMCLNNFSQLPVMKDCRKVEGIIGWKSIGLRLLSGRAMDFVSQCMDNNLTGKIVCKQTPLLDIAYHIADHDYVLVQDCDGKITGIVTASDLSHQFITTARAFMTIGEIEYHLYKLFPLQSEEKTVCCDKRVYIPGLRDYIDASKKPECWERINANTEINREQFKKHVKRVNGIRNNVMHFDKRSFKLKDGLLSPEDTVLLQNTVQFFRDLKSCMEERI